MEHGLTSDVTGSTLAFPDSLVNFGRRENAERGMSALIFMNSDILPPPSDAAIALPQHFYSASRSLAEPIWRRGVWVGAFSFSSAASQKGSGCTYNFDGTLFFLCSFLQRYQESGLRERLHYY